MDTGLSRVAVRLPGRVEAVDDVLVRSGAKPLERRMFGRIYGLRDSPVLAPGERMADHLAEAGRTALGGGPASLVLYGHTLLIAELDLCGTFPDRLRDALGLPGVPFFGVSHVNCTSVLRSVELARRYLARPGAAPDDRVLVLGGDQGSASDRGRYIPGTTVAGDTAAALVVSRGPARYRYLGGASARDTRFHRSLRMTKEEFALFGKVCCEQAVSVVGAAARDAGLTLSDVDWVLPDLSNRMFWRTFSGLSGFPVDRIPLDLVAERGHNFGIDSLLALQHADAAGRLRPGQRCALVSVGQGAYFQSVIVEVVEEK